MLEASLSLLLPIVASAAAALAVQLHCGGGRALAVLATAADAPQASKLGCHEYSGKTWQLGNHLRLTGRLGRGASIELTSGCKALASTAALAPHRLFRASVPQTSSRGLYDPHTC